ncbi:MAG: magnesium transporter [Candidatus Aenigmarchaeota archaeon]|nr:magnesium transporter [Candidatus Aenigmarchaeota archaeon]
MSHHHISQKFRKQIIKLKRHRYHILQHKIREKHNVSRGTVFYMKEYGPHSHVSSVIIKESFKMLVLAALFSTIGGIGLQGIKQNLFQILPLLILLPALNDMIGDFGTIVSSKFTTALYLGKIKGNPLTSPYVKELFLTVLVIAILSAIYISSLSYGFAILKGFEFSASLFLKIASITLFSTLLLVLLIFGISVFLGMKIYRAQEDPNNFLIPITTSVADLGSMLIFSLLVLFLL